MLSKITNIFKSINRLLYSIDNRTTESIKRGFFFLIFLLILGGIYLGYSMGKDSAQINSTPLAENTNELFEIEMARERDEMSNEEMTDEEGVFESETKEGKLIQFKNRQGMEQQFEDGIIESGENKKKGITSPMLVNEPIIEGEYRIKRDGKADVNPIKNDIRRPKSAPGPIIQDNGGSLVNDRKNTKNSSKRNTDIRSLKKARPQPIQNDAGIISN